MMHATAILIFLALNVADAASTFWGLRLGLSEGNPLPAAVLRASGEWGMYGLKAWAMLLIIAIILLFGRRYPRLWRALWVGNGLVAVAAVNNLAQIGRL